MNPDLELLSQIKLIPVRIWPTARTLPIDDGSRAYLVGELPDYLRVKEIHGADGISAVYARTGKANEWEEDILFSFLVPCDMGCKTLADPVQQGCNTIHIAAHHPSLTVAELKLIGARTAAYEDVICNLAEPPRIFIYSDGSVTLEHFPDAASPMEAFRDIKDFIRKYLDVMVDAKGGSAMQEFRLFAAEHHIDYYFEALMPV